MKKLIALLLVLCTVFSLCACGSSSKKKNIDEITEDDLYAAADQLMGREEEEAPANSGKDLGPIEDYLVTVEITPENFYEYFEWIAIPQLDEFGDALVTKDSEGNIQKCIYRIGLKSKKYDEGLIIYDIEDDVFEYEVWGETYDWIENGYGNIYKEISSDKSDFYNKLAFTGDPIDFSSPITSSDQYEVKLGRCKGTVTFLKSEYVVETERKETTEWYYGYNQIRYSYKLADGSYFSNFSLDGTVF